MDFLISLAAVTVAVGLMIQAIEVNAYYQKEAMDYNELKILAETAADLLVASADTTCAGVRGESTMNCIEENAVTPAVTNSLVPAGYGYKITDGLGLLKPGLKRGSLEEKDFYEVKRTIFINDLGTGPTDLSVKVWKE